MRLLNAYTQPLSQVLALKTDFCLRLIQCISNLSETYLREIFNKF